MKNTNLSRVGEQNGMYGVHRFGKENPFYGKRHTEETKQRLSKANMGKVPWLGRKHSEETRRKMSLSKKGRRLTEEWKKNLVEASKKGQDSPHWKEKPTYDALHMWIRKYKGLTNECSRCGRSKKETVLHWANIDHKYRRNLEDYICLCVRCHWEYDKKFNDKKNGVNRKDLYNLEKYFT